MKDTTAKVISAASAASLAKKLRAQRKKIVFTNGCYDILHPGHVRLLQFAKSKGDVLILGVNSDSSIRWLKGPERPIVALKDRLQVLAAIRYIDYLVPFSAQTPEELIGKIRPDVLVKGSDWKTGQIAGAQYAKKLVLFPLVAGRSSTNIIEKIRKLKG